MKTLKVINMIGHERQEKINFTVINEDFLQRDFGQTKYDLIIMNPPWARLGTKFIDKAVSLLKEGGKLVCIIGIPQFNPLGKKSRYNKGTFYDLNRRGYFLRIESYNRKYSHFNKTNIPANLWFIWQKTQNRRETIVVNREREQFKIVLKGNEYIVPQGNFDWIDYDSGVDLSSGDIAKKFSFKTSSTKGITFLEEGFKGKCMSFPDEISHMIDREKVRKLFEDNVYETHMLHYAQIATVLILPPIKRELILKDEYL